MTELALAAAATVAGASVQSATGFGFALVVSPAFFALFDPHEAVGALLALGVALNLLVLLGEGRSARARWRMLAPMLLAAAPGLVAGLLVLEALSKPVLQVMVGVCVLAAAWLAASARLEVRSAYGVGLTSGTLTTSTSVSGPPLVLWLQASGLGPAEFRTSLAASFLVLNLAGAAALMAVGGTGRMVSAGVLALLLGVTVAGHFLGAWVFRRIDDERFRDLVLGLVALTGAASVAAGLATL